MADRLPQEVLIDILARLTVEDLVRCITVSKSWYSLITSPNFISFHINQTTANTTTVNSKRLLIREHGDHSDDTRIENYSLRLDNDTFEVYKTLDFPLKCNGWNSYFMIIGCVNGVVCLSDEETGYMNVIILWNPSIKKFVTLPEPPVTCRSHGPFGHALGFGFNAVTNDYKVVRAVSLRGYESLPPSFEVYDLSAGYWRTIDSKGFNYDVVEQSSQAFLNGAIHWLGSNFPDSDREFFNVIVSFNLENEVLSVMNLADTMPTLDWPRGPQSCMLSVFGGCLTLTAIQKDNQICSWVMKQYGLTDSWTKLLTIDRSGGLRQEVFGYRYNGEALLSIRTHGGTAMVSYDSNSKQLKYLEEFQSRDRLFDVENFVESLSLLCVKGEPMMKAAENCCLQQKGEEEGKEEGAEEEEEEEEEQQKIPLRKSTKNRL